MDTTKSPQLHLSEFLFIIEQSIHMLYCLSYPDDVEEYIKDVNPAQEMTPVERRIISSSYEQYVAVSVNARFDRFFRTNRELYDVLDKDAVPKLFGDYLIYLTNSTGPYEWGVNKELWVDNETDISINASEEQRSLGNIHIYRIFEPILSNEKFLDTLYNRAIAALPSTYAEDLLIGYEGLEWKLDSISKAHLTSIKDIEWRRMLKKYYYGFLEPFRGARNPKESIKFFGIDATLLLDILLQYANVEIKTAIGKEVLIARLINSNYKNVESNIHRLRNEQNSEGRLIDLARKLGEEKLGERLVEIYKESDYPKRKKQ